MAVTTYWYGLAFVSAFSKLMDLTSETKIGAMLTTNSYVPNQDTHQYHSSVTNELSTANGYTQLSVTGAAGLILTTTTVTLTAANPPVIHFDTVDPDWTSSGAGFTARYIVLVDTAPGATGTDPLIIWSNFGADSTASGGGHLTYTVDGTNHWGTITPSDATGYPA